MITVNGKPSDLDAGITVRALVTALAIPADARGVAVAIDAEVVPRSEWAATTLEPGQHVELLAAMQGGA